MVPSKDPVSRILRHKGLLWLRKEQLVYRGIATRKINRRAADSKLAHDPHELRSPQNVSEATKPRDWA